MYAAPAVASASEPVVTTSELAAIVSVKGCEAVAGVAAESLTATVKLNDPAANGVPLMTPVLTFSVKPFGKDPPETDQV